MGRVRRRVSSACKSDPSHWPGQWHTDLRDTSTIIRAKGVTEHFAIHSWSTHVQGSDTPPVDVSKYFHTLRYLRPGQVYHRVRLRYSAPRIDHSPAPPRRVQTATWQPAPRSKPSLVGPARFRFLNVEHDLGSAGDWNNTQLPRLWIYNLHYFEDLTANDASTRSAWHAALVDRWIRENPPPDGAGWEPYPLSRRIVNWIKWAYAGGQLSTAAIHSLAVQLRLLESRLEYHLLGNHLLANAKALVFGGVFFEGPEADRWLSLGLSILDEQLTEQILADGGHIERSTMYHSIVLEDVLDLYNLLRSAANPPPAARTASNRLAEVSARMRRWLVVMTHPDGEIALFNDAAFGIAPSPDELDQYAQRLALTTVPSASDGLTRLAESGYVRVQKDDAVVIADVGPIGPDYLPGHAHADTLSFELSLGPQRWLVNSGTSTYEPGELRQHQRGTAAHNTVVVDDCDSSEMWGEFRVARRARPFDLRLSDDGAAGLSVSCSHDGYRRLSGRVTHRRMWRLTAGQLEIADTIEGWPYKAVARFHVHPNVRIESNAGGAQPMAMLVGERAVNWTSDKSVASVEPDSYYPRFGVSEPTSCLVATFTGNRAQNLFTWS